MTSFDSVQWVHDGENILSEKNLSAVRVHLETVGNIAVEHWHLYGGTSPTPLAFNDYDEFYSYLQGKVKPGDAIDVYPFPHNAATIAHGKLPNSEGEVPLGGAY
jgi:hypothetical protein